MTEDTESEQATDGRERMARRLRELREDRGLTIQNVADRAGLAISTVSKIERNLMAPTYDRFARLARALGVDVGELFRPSGTRFETGGLSVSRRGETGYLETENYVYEMLFPDTLSKTMVPMLGVLKPLEKMQFDRMVTHPGEEFLMVLEGRVVVQLDGLEDVTLEAGDSMYFDSSRGHLYAADGTDPARILVVCTEAESAATAAPEAERT